MVRNVTFEFVCGDPLRAAIFKVQGREVSSASEVSDDIPKEILSRDTFDWGLFLRELEASAVERDTITSLIALDAAAEVYDLLPGSTISAGVSSQSLLDAPWIPQEIVRRGGVLRPISLTLSQSFACILMFETGYALVDSKHLENTLAMCIDHSIFIPAAFLTDPSENDPSSTIHRVLGSIGEPGAVFLVPPEKSKIRSADPESWMVITHDLWDRELGNYFVASSLHLSLTDWSAPLITAVLNGAKTGCMCEIVEIKWILPV